MSEAKNTYQLIEDYLNGSLSDSEKASFEKELTLNPELQKQVNVSRLANELVFEKRLLSIKELATSTHVEENKNGKWGNIALVSFTTLLIGAVAYFGFKDTQIDSQKPLIKSKKTIESKTVVVKHEKIILPIKHKDIVKSTPQKPSSTIIIATKKSVIEAFGGTSIPISSSKKETALLGGKEETSKLEINNPCSSSKIQASIFAMPACIGEENGSISISNIKGGKVPYTSTLFDKNKHPIESVNQLPAGSYFVVITDASSCTTTENITVKDKVCEKKYHFNPFIGESWEIPIHHSFGSLSIFDKTGNVYFRKEIEADVMEHWSGQSMEGEIKTGYFLFTITYRDGSSTQGSISIVR